MPVALKGPKTLAQGEARSASPGLSASIQRALKGRKKTDCKDINTASVNALQAQRPEAETPREGKGVKMGRWQFVSAIALLAGGSGPPYA